jgi:hypothetical protein
LHSAYITGNTQGTYKGSRAGIMFIRRYFFWAANAVVHDIVIVFLQFKIRRGLQFITVDGNVRDRLLRAGGTIAPWGAQNTAARATGVVVYGSYEGAPRALRRATAEVSY